MMQNTNSEEAVNTAVNKPLDAKNILKNIASLKITVALMSCAMFLILAGTVAQRHMGVWSAVDKIFRSPIAKIQFRHFLPDTTISGVALGWISIVFGTILAISINLYILRKLNHIKKANKVGRLMAVVIFSLALIPFGIDTDIDLQSITAKFPFPGGLTIGVLLYVNLLAAHIVRFRIVGKDSKLCLGVVLVVLGIVSVWFINAGLFQEHVVATVDEAYTRVLMRLLYGLLPAFFLFPACGLIYSWKKAGVILIHFSVFLLFFGELITKVDAVESNMIIAEGTSASYLDHSRFYELACIKDNGDGTSTSICIPMAKFKETGIVTHEQLPFTISPVKIMKNAGVRGPGLTEGVDTGYAAQMLIAELDENSGVRMGAEDSPALVAKIVGNDGKEYGTRGFSSRFYSSATLKSMPDVYEEIEVEGTKWRLILRNEREFLSKNPDPMQRPYIFLKDFQFDKYMGTRTARDFSSLVRIVDPESKTDREVNIWMNNPLRYGTGENKRTYYQSNFDPRTEKTTVLQVVRNRGWMLPYIACMVAAFAMCMHFGQILIKFINKQSKATEEV